VTLSDGSEAHVDLLSIGASGASAFAGINGNTDDALGLNLGQVDFAIALMTDTAHPANKYTSVQASAGLAEFTGIDGLVVKSTDLKVAINRGVQVAAVTASTITTNTQLRLDLQATSGTLHLTRGGDSADVVLSPTLSNAQFITNLTGALESLAGVGAGNVRVTGTRLAGYTIEFIGALAGTDVTGLVASVNAAGATASVSTTTAAQAGVDEIKQITIAKLRGEVPNVDVSVTQLIAAALGVNELKAIVFSSPYVTTGTYQISLAGGGTQTVRFTQNDIENNKANIRNALNALFGVSSGITVSFDSGYTGVGHRYTIAFGGTLAQQDIADLTITESLSGDITPVNLRQGSVATGETQRVTIDNGTATGTFRLSLNYLTLGTFTTGDIAFGADAATVRAALLAASNGTQQLSSQGTIAVTKSGDSYDVAFGGGFAGRDLKNLQVALDVDANAPSGSFTVEYDGKTSAAIAYSSNHATMAGNIQAALQALAGIGAAT